MELIERIPTRELNFVNEMTFAYFKSFAKASFKNDDERQKQFDNIKNFCKTNIKTRGETKRIYSYTETTPLEVGGRLYCGSSLQGIPKHIRGFLMRNTTTDLDMKNAHPTILLYLCKSNNIRCPELEYYVNHREEILNMSDDKEKMKTLYLTAVNSDTLSKKSTDINFKKFDKECKVIQKQITGLSEYKHICDSVPISRTYNWLGSAINRILCVYENKILQEVISFLNKKNIEVCSLAFDGLLMYGNYYSNIELLNELEEFIETKFSGLNMKFSYKEHSTLIQMPTDYEPEIESEIVISEGKDYESIKNNFELTHCKIINRSMFIKKFENRNVLIKKDQLKTSYEHMKFEDLIVNGEKSKIIESSFINKWLDDKNMNIKDEIGVFPTGIVCPSNYYNLWIPFDMELINDYTYNEEAVNKFRKHILILCGNDSIVADYFEKWIAQMIQYPAIKSVCPTLISKEGAGKGTLMKLLEKMLGTSKVYETAEPSRDIWGDFNGIMADTFLVNLNELSKKETIESEGRIKKLITDDSITINNKGVSQYKIKSYHRFIITTNKEDPIGTNKDDRRKFICRSSDELCRNKQYFNEMYELLNDTNVIKSCYEYFKSIPNMDMFGTIPMPITEYQETLMELSISPIEKWLEDFVYNNFNEDEIKLTGTETYQLFKNWCELSGIKYEINSIAFGVRLTNLKITGISKKETKKCSMRVFDIKLLKEYFKMGCLILPKQNAIETEDL
jgi:hypothetical protein